MRIISATTRRRTAWGAYNDAYYAPRGYLYGMYSFTKAMLLHTEGSSLQPIQYLRTRRGRVLG